MECYVCTTINAEEFLNGVQDQKWNKWLQNMRSASQLKQCADKFDVSIFDIY
ncbi:unnamed protein product [Gongylonema pulchrum]|uniref:L-rhamnose mutarotase n=1 Tax=Gongylonema pulchrum TaxID=637853 RepID=A0A183CWK0_9BILA|nr:unnamed protein product [Gongylonema pulchrum]